MCVCVCVSAEPLSAKLHYTDTDYGHVVQHLQLVVSLSVGRVVQYVCTVAGIRVVEFGTSIKYRLHAALVSAAAAKVMCCIYSALCAPGNYLSDWKTERNESRNHQVTDTFQLCSCCKSLVISYYCMH